MYGVVFFLPQFLQSAQGYGPLGAGLRLLPWTATLFVVAPIVAGLVNRLGERPLIVAGLILQAVGMCVDRADRCAYLAFAALVAPFISAGAGVSMAMPAAQNAVLSAVAQPRSARRPASSTCSAFSAGHRCRARRRRLRGERKRRLGAGFQ